MRPLHLLSYLAAPAALAVMALAAPRSPVEAPAVRFDVERAMADVRAIAGGCTHRIPDSSCHRRAASYVAQEARREKMQAREIGFEGGVNVVAEQRGARPGVVVLAAHYDTVEGSPGAADDAAGVAVVLEVARALGRWDVSRRTVRYVFFDREEDGLLGSEAYVSSLGTGAKQEIEAAIAVEVPGFRGGSPVLHTFRRVDVPPGDLVARALAAAPVVDLGDPYLLWLYPLVVRTSEVPFSADDAPFRAAGVPALFVSDASFSTFYGHYHLPTDRTSEIEPAALERTGSAVLRIVADLAAGPPVDRDDRAWLPLGRTVLGHNMIVLVVLLALAPLVTSRAGYSRLAATLIILSAAVATWVDPVVGLVLVAPMGYLSALGPARFLGLVPTVAFIGLYLVAGARLGRPLAYDGGVGPILVVLGAALGLALHRQRRTHRRSAFPKVDVKPPSGTKS